MGPYVRKIIRSAGAATVALTLLATTAATTGCGSSGPSGGIFRLGTSQPIDTLNPFLFQGTAAYVALANAYPTIVSYDDKLQIAPSMATSWHSTHGGTHWRFTIRKGMKWSDGQALDARDAAWTLNTILRYKDGPTAALSSQLENVTKVSAPSPTQLDLKLSNPVSSLPAQLQVLFVLPKQVWGKYATGDGKGLTRFSNPAPLVSGGPFILTSFQRNGAILFERNPNWWGPTPHIDRLGIQMYGSDDAMVSALKSNEIDGALQIPPTAVSSLEADNQIQVDKARGLWLDELGINSNPKKPNHRELLDPRVRDAFDHAIDRNAIVKTAWNDFAEPGGSVVAPAQGKYHDPKVKPATFDIAEANRILDSAGYKRGGDGIRIADGHPMSYSVIFPAEENGASDRSFQIIQSDFAKIGVRLTQQNLDNSAAINAITAPNGKELSSDLYLWGWSNRPDPNFILGVFTCANIGNVNDAAYCNPTYDKLYKAQLAAPTEKARVRIVDRMQQILARDKPYLVLEYRNYIDAHNKCWSGLHGSPEGSFNLLSVQTQLSVHRTC